MNKPKKKITKRCQHNNPANRCRYCGKGYCEHNREKSKCKDCGTGLCQHGRWRNLCREHHTEYCEHNKQKGRCKDCKEIIEKQIYESLKAIEMILS